MPSSSPSAAHWPSHTPATSSPRERLRESRKWTVYPSHAKNDRHTLSDGKGPTLGDFFHIQRGIATGCNKFFVLDRADAKSLGLPAKYLRPDPSQPAPP